MRHWNLRDFKIFLWFSLGNLSVVGDVQANNIHHGDYYQIYIIFCKKHRCGDTETSEKTQYWSFSMTNIWDDNVIFDIVIFDIGAREQYSGVLLPTKGRRCPARKQQTVQFCFSINCKQLHSTTYGAIRLMQLSGENANIPDHEMISRITLITIH